MVVDVFVPGITVCFGVRVNISGKPARSPFVRPLMNSIDEKTLFIEFQPVVRNLYTPPTLGASSRIRDRTPLGLHLLSLMFWQVSGLHSIGSPSEFMAVSPSPLHLHAAVFKINHVDGR